MSYLVTIPVLTDKTANITFICNTILLFRPRNYYDPQKASTELLFHLHTDPAKAHPFNLVKPNFDDQPILNLLFKLYIKAGIRIRNDKYKIWDLEPFKQVCVKYNIRFEYPPSPVFTNPTDDPLHYAIVGSRDGFRFGRYLVSSGKDGPILGDNGVM